MGKRAKRKCKHRPPGTSRRNRLSRIRLHGIAEVGVAVQAGDLTILRGFEISKLAPHEQSKQLELWASQSRQRREGSAIAIRAISQYLAQRRSVSLAELHTAIANAISADV